jgi:hypothetical protein
VFGFGGFEGLQVSFGIGAFPFSFLATTFNLNNGFNDTRIPFRKLNIIFIKGKLLILYIYHNQNKSH